MSRIEIAYALMAVMAFVLVVLVGWRIYHGRGRTIRRQRASEHTAYQATMAAKRRGE